MDVGLDPHMLRREDEARWPDLARLLGIKLDEIQAAARAPRKHPRMTVPTPNRCSG